MTSENYFETGDPVHNSDGEELIFICGHGFDQALVMNRYGDAKVVSLPLYYMPNIIPLVKDGDFHTTSTQKHTIAEYIDEEANKKIGDLVVEMANIRPNVTGLPMVIWIQPDTGLPHGPRIKVQKQHGSKIQPYQWASVSISGEPEIKNGELSLEDFDLVKDFILKHKDKLLEVWNDEISPDDFTDYLKLQNKKLPLY